jgi:hypothetical protein
MHNDVAPCLDLLGILSHSDFSFECLGGFGAMRVLHHEPLCIGR